MATLTTNIPVSTDLYTIDATSYDTFALTFVDGQVNRAQFPNVSVTFDFAAISLPADLSQWVTVTITQPATGRVSVKWAGNVRVDPGVSISTAASTATTVYAFTSTGRDWTVFPSSISGVASDLSSQYVARASLSGRFQRVDKKTAITAVTTTTWADLDTSTDITLSGVQVGDVVEAGLSFTASDADPILFLDVVSVVAGAPVNSWGDNGVPSSSRWGAQCWVTSAGNLGIGGSIPRAVTSNDLVDGVLTLRVRARLNSAGSATVTGGGNTPFTFWARNHQ